MIPERYLKLASVGALAVAPAAMAVYAALLFAILPTPSGGAPGSGGGIDWVNWLLLVAALIVPAGLAAAWHVSFSGDLKAGRNTCPGV